MKKKLATVVVTYNRKELLLNNLLAQFSQTYPISYILIIDNDSNDGTKKFLEEKGILSKENVLYFNTGSNLGGAGGFEYGIRKAYELNCDLICLMDDDGYAINEYTFENVINKIPNYIFEENKAIFLNSLVLCNDKTVSFPFNGILKERRKVIEMALNGILYNQGSPFNSTFINKTLVDTIGFPRGEFFIRFDEADYFDRAINCNSLVGVVTDSLYYHPAASEYEIKLFCGKEFYNDYEAGWKEYYKTRNSFILKLEKGVKKSRLFFKYLYRVIGIFVFDINNKSCLIKFITRGYKDAIKRRVGKVVLPGQSSIDVFR